MRNLIAALVLAVAVVGCSDGVSPERAVEGTYELVSITGQSLWFGTPLTADGGSFVMAGGEYSIEFRVAMVPDMPAHTYTEHGSYSVSPLANGYEVRLSKSGHRARVNDGAAIHQWGDAEIRWRRVH